MFLCHQSQSNSSSFLILFLFLAVLGFELRQVPYY
jgi:hypothetical protein